VKNIHSILIVVFVLFIVFTAGCSGNTEVPPTIAPKATNIAPTPTTTTTSPVLLPPITSQPRPASPIIPLLIITVLNYDGKPIENVGISVTFSDLSRIESQIGYTNKDGRVIFMLRESTFFNMAAWGLPPLSVPKKEISRDPETDNVLVTLTCLKPNIVPEPTEPVPIPKPVVPKTGTSA